MRMAEARARYAARRPKRGEALLGWQIRGPSPTEQESLCPSIGAAMRTAAILADDPNSQCIWIYDGRRLFDYDAIFRRTPRSGGDAEAGTHQ